MARGLSRKSVVIVSLLVFVLIAGATGAAVYLLNQQDTQVATGDADASGGGCGAPGSGDCIPEPDCDTGWWCSGEDKCDSNSECPNGNCVNGECEDRTGFWCTNDFPPIAKYPSSCENCSTRTLDVCRGPKTGGNCQLCEKNGEAIADPSQADNTNCDVACKFFKPGDAGYNTCYERGISGDMRAPDDPLRGDNSYNCRNTQSDVLEGGAYKWNCTGDDDGKSFTECYPQISCDIVLVSGQCINNGVRLTWNGSLQGREFNASTDRVILRIDNKRDEWGTDGSDLFYATNFKHFTATGQDPLSGTMDFVDGEGYVKQWEDTTGLDFTGFDGRYDLYMSASIQTDWQTKNSWEVLCLDDKTTVCGSDNKAPTCSALNVVDTSASATTVTQLENGDDINLVATVSDPENDIAKVEFYWAPDQGEGSYCNSSLYTLIGQGTRGSDGKYRLSWKVTGIPESGGVTFVSNVWDGDGAWATGNPSGKCETNAVHAPNCNKTITIPSRNPDWSINKTGGSVCAPDNQSADATYNVEVSNLGNGEGTLTRIVDTLDDKVQDAWVTNISNGGTVSGGVITWELSVDDAVFAAGETKQFTYEVTIPTSGFGTYDNLVEAVPTQGESFSDTHSIPVQCETENPQCGQPCTVGGGDCPTGHQCVPDGSGNNICQIDACVGRSDCTCRLPETAIFDSVVGRVGAAMVLIGIGGLYMLYDKSDAYLIQMVSRNAKLSRRRKEFEGGFGEE